MEVINDFKNKLLNRREVKTVLVGESNPGYEGATKALADKFKAKDDTIVVRRVLSQFGSDTFLLEAFIYDTLEHKERVEQKPKAKKKVGQ